MRATIAITAAGVLSLGLGGVVLARTLHYRSTATGTQEVPNAIDTDAEAKLRVSVRHRRIDFDLKVTEPIEDVFMAHLHEGPVGANGPIGVWLYPHPAPTPFPPPPPPIDGEFRGRLAKDRIVPADLCWTATAPWCEGGDPQWSEFLDALESGNVYVNLHTSANPGGEIRGQVLGGHGH